MHETNDKPNISAMQLMNFLRMRISAGKLTRQRAEIVNLAIDTSKWKEFFKQ